MARKSWNERMSPARLRRRAIASGFAFSALCSSRSTIWTARGVRLAEHFQLRSQRSFELAAVVGAAAGADGGDVLVGFKKTMDLRKRGQRLLQVIQTKLEEGVIPRHRLGRWRACLRPCRRSAPGRPWAGAGAENGAREWKTKPRPFVFNDGAILQGCKPRCNIRIAEGSGKHFGAKGLNTLVTLTHPRALVTFWL